jgi:hypothetical protein
VKKLNFYKNGKISIPFFLKSKILNLPIQNTHNVSIRCKSIRVKDIEIYVKDNEGKYILAEVYKGDLGRQSIPQNNSLNHV